MRLLIVEDEVVLAEQLRGALATAGHAVDISHDGEEGHFLGETEPYDAIILDLGLPKIDGASVLRKWRQADISTPVLILTARDSWRDKVDGLDAGADDYVTKPFVMDEILARVRALTRRAAGAASPVFRRGGVEFDTRSGAVTLDGKPVVLTAQETNVLSYLLHNAGGVVSRTELSEHVYGYDGDRDSNTIEVFIGRLRRKLGSEIIRTVRGRGYQVVEE